MVYDPIVSVKTHRIVDCEFGLQKLKVVLARYSKDPEAESGIETEKLGTER